MRSSFNKIFWGFLLAFLDFRVIGLDLLPDPVGYFLIAAGVAGLSVQLSNRALVKNYAIALGVISLPTFVIGLDKTDELFTASYLWSVYTIVYMVLQLILVYVFFRLLLEICQAYGKAELHRQTRQLFIVYMTANIIVFFLQPVAFVKPVEVVFAFFLGIAIFLLILNIIFLIWLLRFKKLDRP